MSSIVLLNESCVDQNVDAIVNAANKNLAPGGGVCGEIFKRANIVDLMIACSYIKRPLPDGSAVLTKACQIKNARFIIHAVGPDFGEKPTAFKELFDAYYNSLCVLKEYLLHRQLLYYNTWNKMNQENMDRDSVYADMIKLRRAMEAVIGKKRYDNYTFYVESCIYIDTLHSLLEAGYKVWLVYDCFYGTGFGSQEEFEKMVLEAVWISFVRFKAAYDFDKWDEIF